ncbi:MAG: LCP family protein [Nocardioides sp.]
MTEFDHDAYSVAPMDVSYAGHQPGPKRRREPSPHRGHSALKFLGTTAVVFVLVIAMAAAYGYRKLNSNLNVEDFDALVAGDRPKVVAEGRPLNILVMGSDTRAGDNNIDGLGDIGERSDTTILLHVSADRKRAYGISLPRDMVVDRPECKLEDGSTVPPAARVRWNEAFSAGGPSCTITQFEQLTGVRVKHTVVVDFTGFKGMVDAIDGVDVCIPEDIDDTEHNIQLKAGEQTLRGNDALNYVRVRKNVGDGSDLTRVKRQQAFMASMVKKIFSGETLSRPDRLYGFLNEATKSLTLDNKLNSMKKLVNLGQQFQETGLGKIQFFTIPVVADPDNPKVTVVPAPEADEIWQLIAEDEMVPKRLKDGTIRASMPNAPTKKKPDKKKPGDGGADPDPSADPKKRAKVDADEAERIGLCA